jgi:alginate O-acetyltransferase complex protein AlgI
MSFDSWIYAAFLPLVLLLHHALPLRGRNFRLLVASAIFYGWWDWRFLGLIALSTAVDFVAALRIHAATGLRRRRAWLAASILSNLAILGTFKYLGFFADSLRAVLARFGVDPGWTTIELVLPVGISFYTFQSLSYTIDVFRGRLPPTRSIVEFALYVSFFPQLVAGPIERATRLLPQIRAPRRVSREDWAEGAWLILLGLFKKIGLADALAIPVQAAYGDVPGTSTVHLWRAVYLFTFQIYCDFSGYSDIARGSARLLGFDLMVNFRQPFLAASFRDLWRRWHISLSEWFRDYLYIPLGGSRLGRTRSMLNLLLVMTASGLWHGAAWTFAAWGFGHGLLLAIERGLGGGPRAASPWPPSRAGRVLRGLLVFHAFALLFVLFRARDAGLAMEVYARLLPRGVPWSEWTGLYLVAWYGAWILAIDVLAERTRTAAAPLRWPWPVRGVAYALMILVIFGWSFGSGAFIYFQF